MATYYCDPSAAGSDNGTSQANAWTSLQRAIDGAGVGATQPTAGDTVLCRTAGTGAEDDIAAQIDADGNSGTKAGGYVKYIGVNNSWANDGTRYVIDCQSNNIAGIVATSNFIWLENIEVKNSGNKEGFTTTNAYHDYWVFVNCYAHDNGGKGWDGAAGYLRYATCFRCVASSNTGDGFVGLAYGHVFFSEAIGNGGRGISADRTLGVIGCVAHGNTGIGIYLFSHVTSYGCVSDGNGGDDVNVPSTYPNPVIGWRLTDAGNIGTTNGLNVSSATVRGLVSVVYCGDELTTAIAGDYDELPVDGVSKLTTAGSDANDGYADYANDDFNVVDGSTYDSEAIAFGP